jgi:protein gp37
MGKTRIEWTDASWNPIVGCTEISPGCANCYAARLAATRLRNTPQYKGLAVLHKIGQTVVCDHRTRWTGEVRFLPERLKEPLHWKKPLRIFVCDMGDLFHENVADDCVEQVFYTIANCPQHTFQILTKRADRMLSWFKREWTVAGVMDPPYPNVWLGTSVENQHFADARLEAMRELAALGWLTWVSYEPALDGVNWIGWQFLRWMVSGGESGPQARPSHPDWHRYTRDYCIQQGIPYFFKQWGEWVHPDLFTYVRCHEVRGAFRRVGKKAAGRLLDGRTWDEFPTVPKIRET